MPRQKGFQHSDATRKRMSEAAKRSWQNADARREKVGRTTGKRNRRLYVGSGNPAWKGGRRIQIDKNGRRTVWLWTGRKTRIAEHIDVMEKNLGRELDVHEVVHHKNGDATDNRIENLQLFENNSLHIKEEQKLCLFAKQILFGEIISEEMRDKLLKVYETFTR